MEERDGQKKKGSRLAWILISMGILLLGVIVAFLVCRMNQVRFGAFTWPLIACVDLFAFTTIGFFSTEGRTEVLYGACSIVAAACSIVQLAILF